MNIEKLNEELFCAQIRETERSISGTIAAMKEILDRLEISCLQMNVGQRRADLDDLLWQYDKVKNESECLSHENYYKKCFVKGRLDEVPAWYLEKLLNIYLHD